MRPVEIRHVILGSGPLAPRHEFHVLAGGVVGQDLAQAFGVAEDGQRLEQDADGRARRPALQHDDGGPAHPHPLGQVFLRQVAPQPGQTHGAPKPLKALQFVGSQHEAHEQCRK
jgi:hypothetical protein